MSVGRRVAGWLGVRESEMPVVLLSCAGAFLVLSFLVLARALREAAFLAVFDATSLPYVTGGVVILGFPLAILFGGALTRMTARRAMRLLTLAFAVAVAAVWPFLPESAPAVVVFYLVTAAGTVLLTSGFWLVVSEMLVVREAKRLFGLISAGGTLGMLATGLAVGAAVRRWDPVLLVPVLVALLVVSAALNEFVPRGRAPAAPDASAAGWRNSVGIVFRQPHVRVLTLIVLLVAAVGTIADFQFKEAAQNAFGSERELAAFFGAFYGWTGGLALGVQLLVTTRIMQRGGIARSIAVHPAVLLALSAGMLAAPGLVLATGLRGADSTLKKSLFRSVVEFLWVPVPAAVRRRSKTFVDTMGENAGDGIGALVVLAVVTLGGLSSRWLSVVVIVLALVLIGLARRMGREYFATLRCRLAEGDSNHTLAGQDMRSAVGPRTLSRIDVTRLLAVVDADRPVPPRERPIRPEASSALSVLGDDDLRRRLESAVPFLPEDVDQLARSLAREGVRDLAASRLMEIGEPAAPALAAIVSDESADFVVRRRVAQVLAAIPGEAACAGLLAALGAGRFEVRYRAARSLARRQRRGEACSRRIEEAAWRAIRAELTRGRAVWELARLLDANEHDDFSGGRAVERGDLSLEHVFRLLGLVLDASAIRSAWGGIRGDHAELGSLALEYLEQVLPDDVRRKLWPFIGDLSVEESRREIRPLAVVIGDLLETGETLFAGDERARLQRFLGPRGGASTEAAGGQAAEPGRPDAAD